MRKTTNTEHFEGRLYEMNLEVRTGTNSDKTTYQKDYLTGSISVATDEACTNIVQVHYGCVLPTFKSGKKNRSFDVLSGLVTNGKTVLEDGAEEASLVSLNPSFSVNDFYTDKENPGEYKLVSVGRNDGGFANSITKLNADESKRSHFEFDMLITHIKEVEGDEEEGTDDSIILKGATFSYRGELMPVEVSVVNKAGIAFFEGLDIDGGEPVFTKVWGSVESQNIKKTTTTESAFGEADVKVSERKVKRWVVEGTSPTPYEFDDDKAGISLDEIKEKVEERAVALAEALEQAKEYAKNKGKTSTTVKAKASTGDFNF